jgi:hypothetical protein
MKNIINAVWSFLESFGLARAAAYLARQGRTAEARALYE